MQERPTPVVMVSSLTAEGADVTLACLQRGAVDFVLKPSGSISLDIATVGGEIVAKTRAAAGAQVQRPSAFTLSRLAAQAAKTGLNGAVPPRTNTPPLRLSLPARPLSAVASGAAAPARESPAQPAYQRLEADTVVVAIASSTGGPAALQEVIPHLPADLNAAYLIVQHLPAGFTRSLASRLDHSSALTVREAQAGDALERGLVLIAPGGRHLELDAKGRVVLNDDPPLWGVRPAADVMMRAVAARFGPRALGVVLTGMGCDGALGVKAIKGAGGLCLAQDEASCVVYGMPRAAFETGVLAQVVPLPDMAAAIARQIAARGRGTQGSGLAGLSRHAA
jgi:two-component system chemotaxis response regulator CheB